jgi:hypothetical protein
MRRARLLLVLTIALLSALAPGGGARAGGQAPPACSQVNGYLGGDLSVQEFTHRTVVPDQWATRVGAADPQAVGLNWDFYMNNGSGGSVSNPTVTVDSGLPTSVFGPSQLQPISFPISCGVPSIGSQQALSAFSGQLQETSTPTAYTPTNFTMGYTTERDVSPLSVPAGGGQQTVTARVTLVDPRYSSGNVNINVNIGGTSVVSMSGPSPLTHGENLSSSPGKFGSASWSLSRPALNVEYDFTATLYVANPYGIPWTHLPLVQFDVPVFGPAVNVCPGSDVQVCIADPTLDGARPNAGRASYSIGSSGHSWSLQHADWYDTWYPEGTRGLNLSLQVTPNNASTGTNVVAISNLSNLTPNSQTVTLTFDLRYRSPSGAMFSVDGARTSLSLAAGQTVQRTFTFTVTNNFARGSYVVFATATASGYPSEFAQAGLNVN